MKYLSFILCCLMITACAVACSQVTGDGDGTGIIIGGVSDLPEKIATKVVSNVESCSVNVLDKGDGNLELLAIEDETYIFEGWYLDDDKIISDDILTMINVNNAEFKDFIKGNTLAVEARFALCARVDFDLNGGSASGLKTKFNTSDDDAALPFDEVRRNGYILLGWEDGDGNRYSSLPKGMTGRVNLKAMWAKDMEGSIFGSVRTVSAAVPFGNAPAPMQGISSTFVVDFKNKESVYVYALLGGEYVDMSILYTQFIHNFDRMNEVRYSGSDSSEKNRYNNWNMSAPRYDSGVGFKCEIDQNNIFIYLTSADPKYKGYIENYFSRPIYTFRYNEFGEIYLLTYGNPDGDDIDDVFYMYYMLFEGMLPKTVSYDINYTDNTYKCSEITDVWEASFKPCDMNIDEIGNKILVTKEGSLCYLANSNMLSPAFTPTADENGERMYELSSVVSIRNHLAGTPFIVNTSEGYKVFFFSALNGMAYDLSFTDENGDRIGVYYFVEMTDGSMITLFNAAKKEFLEALYEFEYTHGTSSVWASENFWTFHDYKLD